MLAKVSSCALIGLEGTIVEVEVDISPGLPLFAIVGLPDAAVSEAKERVRSAIRNSGYTFPMKHICANLAPADLKKAGPAYDLPIAIGILLSSHQIEFDASDTLFLGELSLDGSLRHTNGILSMVALAHRSGLNNIVVPEADAMEAALVEGANILPFSSLAQLASYMMGEIPAPKCNKNKTEHSRQTLNDCTTTIVDFAHIKGQEHVKRALEVAAPATITS
jgi:magnesium chelatase family protein